MATLSSSKRIIFTEAPVSNALFNDTRWSWIWVIVRLYVGYTWLSSGIGKFGNPAWMQTGEAIKGYWTRAVAIPAAPAQPLITYDWYRSFLQSLLDGGSYVWFSKLIVFGEILIGLGLILGIFTGIAAFFGAFMNWNFLLAGTVSIIPVLLPLQILLMLAWKTAGWWGLDRWALTTLGTPWQPGRGLSKPPVSP